MPKSRQAYILDGTWGRMAAMFQLVKDNIKEGQEAFFPSWKNEGTWKPFQMVSIRAASFYGDPVNYEKVSPWAEATVGHTA